MNGKALVSKLHTAMQSSVNPYPRVMVNKLLFVWNPTLPF